MKLCNLILGLSTLGLAAVTPISAHATDIRITVENPNSRTIGIRNTSCGPSTCAYSSTIRRFSNGNFDSDVQNTSTQLYVFEYGSYDKACRAWLDVEIDAAGTVTVDNSYVTFANALPGDFPICSEPNGDAQVDSAGDVVWTVRIQNP